MTTEDPAAAPARRTLTIGGWFALTRGLLLVVAIVGGAAGLISLHSLSNARTDLLDRIAPVNNASIALQTALLNEETSVRGYLLTGDEQFLEPFEQARRDEQANARLLTRSARVIGVGEGAQRVVAAAERWRTAYAEPAIAAGRRGQLNESTADLLEGKALFDAFRTVNTGLRERIDDRRARGRQDLTDTAVAVRWIFIAVMVLIILSVLGTALVLRRQVIGPITGLARRVREVATGDHDTRISAGGAREVQELGDDVEALRAQIVQELSALEETQQDLKRSNAELEQFAYVASHDLQEPLRKVASFCQMLQRRYGGQLDERGDQYIEFAVDGAKRMQELINDLLAFSRVGRVTETPTVVSCDDLVARVRTSLAAGIEAKDATIESDHLPQVRGEASLLALVFQNLIANGLKFQEEGVAPVVRISVVREDAMWRFTVADNGIGIAEEYADRIFIIFQRLHPRSAYEGTGIGLAMCRKVIEYHGGTIWLDTEVTRGATFHFTLPVLEEDPSQ